jgi:beta-glucosidase
MSVTNQEKPIFLNPDYPIQDRINDLISQLTLEEKVSQMMYTSPSIDRLNIPEYNWWNECLHGVARGSLATIFPQAIGMAATFDPELLFKIATAISDEARAIYNAAIKVGNRSQNMGLTFWTPNINIFRDPRWGRGQETYGEDPWLTGQMGKAFVKGLQGDDPNYLKTAACAKHFAVHSGPEKLRHEFNAHSNKKDLFETYLPAFKELVDAGVESVMCAYNATNGKPCCANNYLLKDILRGKWNFKGHVVSDCWALVDFYSGHKICDSAVEASALALQAGVNLNCGSVFPNLVEAVKRDLITEKEIDNSLAILLSTRFKLGMFDPEGSTPYDQIPVDIIDCEKHRMLALETAHKSIVLLKNNGALPLKKNLRKYYITGPNASSIESLIGNYHGVNGKLVTFLEGISAAIDQGSQIQYRPGILLSQENFTTIDLAYIDIVMADVCIVVLGINNYLEGEEGDSLLSPYAGDRLDYNLPANQVNYLKKINAGTNKPIIAVVTGGSPMNLAEIENFADAVILAWYPGEEGGTALADILFGKISPSGKLPMTFPKSFEQLPDYEDYSMKGRTYRYMEQEPLYPFGFGLTYSRFELLAPQLSSATLSANSEVELTVRIANQGEVASDEVVQLYVTPPDSVFNAPLFSLKGIRRIHLQPEEAIELTFPVTSSLLKTVDADGDLVLVKGMYRIFIGTSLPTEQSLQLGSNQYVYTEIEVV